MSLGVTDEPWGHEEIGVRREDIRAISLLYRRFFLQNPLLEKYHGTYAPVGSEIEWVVKGEEGKTKFAEFVEEQEKVYNETIEYSFELADTHNRSLVPESATIGQLEAALETRITVPLLSISMLLDDAIMAYVFGVMVLLLYLLSVVLAINGRVADSHDQQSGHDWLFFHPGPIGPLLGASWVASPSFLIMLAVWKGRTNAIGGTVWAGILLSLAGCICWKMLTSRRIFLTGNETEAPS